jgi:hypothetical protein
MEEIAMNEALHVKPVKRQRVAQLTWIKGHFGGGHACLLAPLEVVREIIIFINWIADVWLADGEARPAL